MSNEPSVSILNANQGVSNVIDNKVIRKDLFRVSDRLFDILSTHYGPFSGFAALDSRDPLEETTFTKDGIGIVRAIEFLSPQEEWVRKTIAYIGTKIESSVGDGTTSAMMFTCAMLKHMLAGIDKIKPVGYNKLRDTFNFVIDTLRTHINATALKVPDTDYDNVVKTIVFNQVYTSSHGDVELAKALADAFAATPRELWDRMTYERRTYESSDRFTVVRPEGQYQMRCEVMMPAMLNKELSTWFESDKCKLLITNDSIRINTPVYDKLLEVVPTLEDGETLAVLAHKRMDTESYQDLLPRLTKWKDSGKSVAIFNVDPDNPQINDFVSLMLLSDVDITKMRPTDYVMHRDVYVKFKNDVLTLDKLYEVPEEYKDSKIRFQVIDGKHMQYTDYLEAVKKYADGYSKVDQSPEVRKRRTQMYRMYSKLMFRGTPTLVIGGGSYDNLAMIDVVDDCMRAAAKALTHGVVLGNNRTLYAAVRHINEFNDHLYGGLYSWVLDCIEKSLEDIAGVAYDRLYPRLGRNRFAFLDVRRKRKFVEWWYTHTVDILRMNQFLKFEASTSKFSELKYLDDHDTFLNQYLMRLPDAKVIVQPANTDIIMLERFAEVAIKYVLTERIVVHGAAYVDKRRIKR